MAELEDLVKCPICCDILKSPRMLRCQHTLCFNCLGQYVASKMLKRDENGFVSFANTIGGYTEAKAIAFNCPECDELVECKRLSDIERSLKCNQILDFLNSKKKGFPKCTYCKVGERNVTYGCINCDKQFCKKCFEQEKCSSSHYVGKLVDAQTISCMTHELGFQYLCVTCDVCICLQCFLEHHHIHKVKDIASVDAELRDMLRRSKSFVDGNSDDASKLEKEFDRMKEIQYGESSDALKRWQFIASKMFEDILDEMLKEKDEALAKRIQCISEDVKALSQGVEGLIIEMKKPLECQALTLKFKSDIEKRFSKCSTHEKVLLNLRADLDQQKNKAFLKVFKELFLAKFTSLIDKDIEDSCRKDGKDQVRKKDSDQSTPSRRSNQKLSPNAPSYDSWMYAKSSLRPFMREKDQASADTPPPSNQTSSHREHRLNPSHSISYPQQLNRAAFGQNESLKQSESENDIHSPANGPNNAFSKAKAGKVTIRDPKSGKDVTDSILKNRNRRS